MIEVVTQNIEHIKTSVLAILLIWNMLGDERRKWVLSSFKRNKDIAETVSATNVADSAGTVAKKVAMDAIFEQWETMKMHMAKSEGQNMDKDKIIAKLYRKLNTYDTFVHLLLNLCDKLCDKSNFCKGEIKKLLTRLNILKNDESEPN